jgi:hypothetical protein
MGTAALLSVMDGRGTYRKLPQQKLCMNIATGDLCIRKVIFSLFVTCKCNARLRHCTTSRKVAGSIPDGVTEIFLKHNPSGRTMALELTQPLTEMSTRNVSWG